jgi:general secretion pathway protein H
VICFPHSEGEVRPNGFTLLELLVTLALLGMIATLSLPYVSGGRSAAGLLSDTRELASRLRAAREIALATRSSTVVTIHLVKPRVDGPGEVSPYIFTAAERVSVSTAKGQETGESARITFMPDGGSSGGVVMMQDGARTRVVRVEWLTGTVSVSEAVR